MQPFSTNEDYGISACYKNELRIHKMLIMKKFYPYLKINLLFALLAASAFSAFAQRLTISTAKKWYCPDETAVLEASSGFAKYLWSTNSNDRIIKVNKPGKYYVTAWDSVGKPQKDSIEIFYYKTKSLSVSTKSNPICAGDTAVLEASAGFLAYQWSVGSATTRSIKVWPTTTTTYYVYGKDSSGCMVKAAFTLQVKSCHSGSPCKDILAGNPTKMCKGGFIYLEAKSGYKSYVWSNSKTDRVIKVTESGKYYVTVTDSANNTCKDSITITYFDTRKVEIYANPKTGKICKGSSITLEASSGYKAYWWNNSATTKTITVSPTATTHYVVKASDSNGCITFDTFTVQVDTCHSNSKCADLIKARELGKCAGDSILLEGPTGYIGYKWYLNNTSFAVYERKVWAKEPGMYIIQVKDSSNNYCSDTVYVHNYARKTLQAGPYPVKKEYCIGDTIGWEASNGFAQYLWSNKETGRHFKMVAQKNFELSLTVIDSFGCKQKMSWNIIVKDCSTSKDSCANLITVYPKTSVCHGDSIKLIGKEGMASYSWSNRSTDRYIWAKESGKFYLEAKTPGGKTCRDSVSVTVFKKKDFKISTKPNPAKICPGDTVIIEASAGMKSYSWNVSNSNSHKIAVVLKEAKTITVTAVDSNGCYYKAEVKVTIDSACKKQNHKDPCKEVKVYPNPFKSKITLEMQDTLGYDLKIEVFDRYSKQVHKDVWKSGNKTHTLDLSSLSSGYYLLKIHCKNGVIMRKLVKQ